MKTLIILAVCVLILWSSDWHPAVVLPIGICALAWFFVFVLQQALNRVSLTYEMLDKHDFR